MSVQGSMTALLRKPLMLGAAYRNRTIEGRGIRRSVAILLRPNRQIHAKRALSHLKTIEGAPSVTEIPATQGINLKMRRASGNPQKPSADQNFPVQLGNQASMADRADCTCRICKVPPEIEAA